MKTENVEDIYELSPLQEGMLFHTLLTPGSGMYFEQTGFPLDGPLDIQSFERAWQTVVDRHTILRTSFHWEDLDNPLQVVQRTVKLPVEYLDWTNLSAAHQEERLDAFLAADRERGFELSVAPLLRLAVIALAQNAWYIVFSLHHLLLDGWSSDLVYKEAAMIYEALCRGEQVELPPCRPYGDYIAWLQDQDLTAAEVFWRRMLARYAGPSRTGADQESPEESGCDEQQIHLPAATTAALQSMARKHQLTLNTLIQGAWALLLSTYTGDDDVVFGYTVSGRPPSLPGVESMVGLFINTLPLRVQISRSASLIPWLRKIQAWQFEASRYEYSPLVKIQEWSQTQRGTPLFQSMVDFGNFPIGGAGRDRRAGISGIRSFTRTNYPLNLLVWPGSELGLKIIYSRPRYESDAISRMLGHLRTILEGMLAGPEQRLGDVPILAEPERRQLLIEWNQTHASYPRDECIHQLFESRAHKTPDAIAMVHREASTTYGELNSKANQLAHYLRRGGVERGALVGICIERSIEAVVGMLGILKAGAVYVPMDPAYPRERLAFMLQDSGASALLTTQPLADRLPLSAARTICLDADWESIGRESTANPESIVTSEECAYAIYTSGSTGIPKAVLASHRAAVNRFSWMWKAWPFGPREICCQKTALSFVDSVWEIFGPLLHGIPNVIISTEDLEDADRFVRALAAHHVTRIVVVPSLLRHLLDSVPDIGKQVPELKLWVTSGEQLMSELARRFEEQLPGATLLNLYGSSEVAADVTWHVVSDCRLLERVPIGRPIANTRVYVLNRELQPAPIGVTGEIHVGGDALAHGYLNNPELTAQKFIPAPFAGASAARLYKTGDLGRFLPDGSVEFLGRVDSQVKVRGVRIELGEIESVLRAHPAIATAVVTVRGDGGDERVIAYVVPNDEPPTQDELRSFTLVKLPASMAPTTFVVLDALPLLPNGKVDRNALPPPGDPGSLQRTRFVAPRTSLEKDLAGIWSEILGVRQIGVDDDFYLLGGHSLLAMRIVSRVRSALQIEIPLRTLFESPTVAGLARAIQEHQVTAPDTPIAPVTRQEDETRVEELTDEEVNAMLSDILNQRQPE